MMGTGTIEIKTVVTRKDGTTEEEITEHEVVDGVIQNGDVR